MIFQISDFLNNSEFVVADNTNYGATDSIRHLSYDINSTLLRGKIDRISWENIEIAYGNVTAYKPMKLNLGRHSNQGTVKIYFNLNGYSTFDLEGLPLLSSFNCNEHNIMYIPGKCKGLFKNSTCRECKTYINWNFIEINLLPAFFMNYLPAGNPVFSVFRGDIEQDKPAVLYPHNVNISLRIFETISAITQCQHDGVYKRLFIESKILELLMLQFKEMEEYKCPVISRLKKSEIEKIYKAREILLCNIDNPCPLMELALKVGTNECTLKKGFKEVFGFTVFGYLYDVRMKEAHRLLVETEDNVCEVAEKMGYKNATHFTSAFKKKYGILPSKVKQGR